MASQRSTAGVRRPSAKHPPRRIFREVNEFAFAESLARNEKVDAAVYAEGQVDKRGLSDGFGPAIFREAMTPSLFENRHSLWYAHFGHLQNRFGDFGT